MNVTFHTLGALATAAVLSSRDRIRPSELGIGFVVGVLLHGLLDYLPHGYPIWSPLDVLLSLTLVLVALLLASHRTRPLVTACFVGCVAPDVIDLGPALANTRLGWSLPVVKVFPWHWPQYSGSVYDGRFAVFSALLHLAVVVTACGVLAVYRRDWSRERSDALRPSDG